MVSLARGSLTLLVFVVLQQVDVRPW